MNVTLPIHLQLPVYQVLQESGSDQDDYQSRIHELIELDEVRRGAVDQNIKIQDKVKRNFDKSSRSKNFQKGDIVLLWDKQRENPSKHGKFDSLWMGPYIIHGIAGVNSFHLSDMDGEKQNLQVNRHLLKLFFSDNICCPWWHLCIINF